MNGFLEDLFSRRKSSKIGRDACAYLLERNGAKVVEISPNDPNPNTFRNDYYYNSSLNAVYRKTKLESGSFVWKRMR